MVTKMSVVATLMLTISSQVGAAMHKCPGPNGTVTFQDQPCEGAKVGNISAQVARTPKVTASDPSAANTRAAFREMAQAWRLETLIKSHTEDDIRVMNNPGFVSFIEGALVDRVTLPKGVRVDDSALRDLARKHAPAIAAVERRQIADVQSTVNAYEEEYVKVFTADELRHIAAYYRTDSGKARNDEMINKGKGRTTPDTPAMQAQARAFYATTAGEKLSENYTKLQSLALTRHSKTIDETAEFIAFMQDVNAIAKKRGANQ
jgi:hypothetical protein